MEQPKSSEENLWNVVLGRKTYVISSPSGELKVVTRFRRFRVFVEWQIQVRGAVMEQGIGTSTIIDALFNVANDLDVHNLTFAAGECRTLARELEGA